MNWHNQIFLWWIIALVVCLSAQYLEPEYNLGIVAGVLLIPIFIHDIIINVIKDLKVRSGE